MSNSIIATRPINYVRFNIIIVNLFFDITSYVLAYILAYILIGYTNTEASFSN